MANINRDYLIVLDAKSSVISEADELKYYITDQHSQNLFVNLVVRDIERINKYVEVHDPEKYQLELHIIKPNNDIVRPPLQANLLSVEDAIYAFELPKEAVDYIGTYKCELRVTYQESEEKTITTSNKFKYRVKRSIYNDLDGIVEAPKYPIVIQLLDKLSDINQYEEDRRANELARQLAEEQRQTRFNTLDADMTDSIQAIDDKVVDVENRISTKEQVVDKLIVDAKADINNYKVAKDQEIDDYKTAKDTEINNAIAAQDNKINTAITTQNDTITQAIANQDTKIDTAITAQNDKIEAVQNNDAVQNNKLDTLQNKATIHEERITATEVKNTEQDNRLDIIENTNIQQNIRLDAIVDKNIEQDSRLDTIEAIDVAQNSRLDAIEVKSQQQDDRLLDIEKVNKRQDMNLKCLFAESKNNMIDITEEGNSIYLQNSTTGYTLIDEIKGNTLVNCNKEPDKELILNGNINTSGDNAVILTEGVDGGLVDVALEGNTLVNVSKTKDSAAISKAYTVENSGNRIALQGDVDGSCRPVITGNTLWIDNDTEEILTAFDETKNLRLQSTFEDNLVTQEMVDNGEEVSDSLGKYKVEYKSTREDGTVGNTKTIYLNSPLLEGDTIEEKDGGIYHAHRSDKIVLDGSDDEGWFLNKAYSPGGQYISYTSVSDAKPKSNSIIYCDKLKYIDESNERNDCIWVYNNQALVVQNSTIGTIKEFRQWLQQNPTTVVYQLATPTYELIEQSNLVIPSYTNGHLDFNTTMPVQKVEFKPFSEELTYLYANTQYTVQFVSDRAITADITLGGTQLLAQSIVIGLNRISITTPETLANSKLIMDGLGANISKIVVTDTDREFRYFEGMKSVGEGGNLVITSSNSDNSLSNTQTLTHAPLRSVRETKDRYVLLNGNWHIERKCGIRAYQEGDKDNYKTDLINTVYPLEMATYEEIDYNPLEVYSDTTYISTNSTIPTNVVVKNHGYNCLLKPSTTYTISSNLGLNTVTTPSALTEDCLRFMDTDTSDITTMKNVLVLEGDWTSKADLIPANFSGIESAFEQEYDAEKGKYRVTAKVVGKNLFDGETRKGYYSNGNFKVSNSNLANVNPIRVRPNTSYVGSGDRIPRMTFYDKDMNFLLYAVNQCNISPSNAHYMNIHSNGATWFQIEQGNTATTYEPYKENNITFYINEPLRGVGDVKDRVYVKDDKVIVQRNCGIRPYEDGDFGTYPTDKINTVYPLAEPAYEEVEYNDTKLFIESFKNSTLSYNSNVPVSSTVHYSYSVPIIDTVAQTANVTDQQDSMIIDLATQVAVMEMMLM